MLFVSFYKVFKIFTKCKRFADISGIFAFKTANYSYPSLTITATLRAQKNAPAEAGALVGFAIRTWEQ
jgi:hypothetical protein